MLLVLEKYGKAKESATCLQGAENLRDIELNQINLRKLITALEGAMRTCNQGE